MKLLCIGRSGQVARALAERSAASDVICNCLGRPDLNLLLDDDIASALDAQVPNLVVNAAAYTNVDGAETDRDAAFALNTTAAGTLARLCAERAIPLVHLSTDYVFDGSGDRAWREADIAEPINVYGSSKLAGEHAVRAAGDQHIILRTSWVYSPFGANFVKTMLRLADERGSASVVNDQIGSPTSAFEIADVILQIARHISAQPKTTAYGTYHFAASGFVSWADVAAFIFEIYEQRLGCKIELKSIPTSDYPTPADRPRNSRLNTTKITEEFGVEPEDWPLHLRATVDRLLDERVSTP